MSQENVEIVRAMIDAANRGDWDAMIKDAAPGFVWDDSRAIGTDNRVVLRSAAQARDFFRGLNRSGSPSESRSTRRFSSVITSSVPHTTTSAGETGSRHRRELPGSSRSARQDRACLPLPEKDEALEAAGLSE